jgi:hypothetical protein
VWEDELLGKDVEDVDILIEQEHSHKFLILWYCNFHNLLIMWYIEDGSKFNLQIISRKKDGFLYLSKHNKIIIRFD